MLANLLGHVCRAFLKRRWLIAFGRRLFNNGAVVVCEVICSQFFCLIEPHLENLGGVFDGRLSKPGHFTPIAGDFSNFEGVYVLH